MLNKSKFINNGKFNLIVIGRLDSNKNVGILLEALTHVKHRELLHLDIVGDGMLKEKLQQYAIEHDINNMILGVSKLQNFLKVVQETILVD